jgi:hypothetical protein
MVDIYPKGVWLQKCFAIFTSGAMKEVPDRVLRSTSKYSLLDALLHAVLWI